MIDSTGAPIADYRGKWGKRLRRISVAFPVAAALTGAALVAAGILWGVEVLWHASLYVGFALIWLAFEVKLAVRQICTAVSALLEPLEEALVPPIIEQGPAYFERAVREAEEEFDRVVHDGEDFPGHIDALQRCIEDRRGEWRRYEENCATAPTVLTLTQYVSELEETLSQRVLGRTSLLPGPERDELIAALRAALLEKENALPRKYVAAVEDLKHVTYNRSDKQLLDELLRRDARDEAGGDLITHLRLQRPRMGTLMWMRLALPLFILLLSGVTNSLAAAGLLAPAAQWGIPLGGTLVSLAAYYHVHRSYRRGLEAPTLRSSL
ncbi:hypothetical protein ACWCXX_35715 [Streptomyces sp. NPDC001732]